MNNKVSKPNADFDFLKRMAKGVAAQFGKNCEVTVHDLTDVDCENTIIAIENGHVTGREVGDGATEVVIEAIHSGNEVTDRYNYFTRTRDGKELISSSIFVKDEKGEAIALLGINFDVSEYKLLENIVKGLLPIQEGDEDANKDDADTITNNVSDLLDVLIEEAYQLIGKPVNMMTRGDKVRAIRYLEQRGALLIKKSGDKISRFFDISKYTLYGYLSSDDED